MKSVYINASFACLNDCRFCPVANKRTISWLTDEIKRMIIDSSRDNSAKITLSGGEITTRMDFIEIVEFAMAHSVKVVLQTTARAFCDSNLAKQLHATGPIDFYISLHSHIPEIHDQLTTRHGSYQETVNGIHNLLDLGCKVDTNLVIANANFNRLLEYVKWLETEFDRIRRIYITYPMPLASCFDNRTEVLVPFSKLRLPLSAALNYLEDRERAFAVVDVPLCVGSLMEYRNNLMQPARPYDMVFTRKIDQDLPEGETGKAVFAEVCKNCMVQVREKCPGVYLTYLDMYSTNGLVPFC